MEKEQFQTLLRFFKALADESRLKIVGILANQECSVEELAVLLQLKEPTVSHHLAKLKELNLVTMRPEGNSRLYQLDSNVLQSISKQIFTPEQIASLINDVDTEAWENKVLKNYFDGDVFDNSCVQHLKEIPASRKKRLVILKWLANRFEIGIQYPERAVNEILKRYYPDYATLRRELIGYQLMQRENGVYWRSD
ncbi:MULTISPECIES: metalloregulator ArsR/SmtB family transcription factor [Nostoc]|jgi:DNA-binding transcriptional ArsR family regulator|uniref:Metalloregulator ArsR/SmtB family transcription factor n=1 Tax=Nostoc punctiforme FACHB-252 TaxID=1357509 RepID=A0ABR8HDG8_NOSPU|nr:MULTISPECIES: metalloregulator ArsR/SmtB family transcription factor [Nostoc]MBC1237889.1 metalloregulator ArsR/SmtB family transcription factor [Nostoc sp. 2RC]MBD2613341.1 metalloregulator ArsR/SmtB family transcription factor [Nostoc punctiforme FACHB-252]MBL1199270.1 metalloregulator ArsR/SmtB family transcription factor [Nostoc sp. GBBB01]MDZ8011318.1 metalloregulator ArsR/SmtB family transcription factor [Nostoc sp. ZfuVER08]